MTRRFDHIRATPAQRELARDGQRAWAIARELLAVALFASAAVCIGAGLAGGA